MLHPEEDQPVNRSQKSTFKPADSGQFQIGTRIQDVWVIAQRRTGYLKLLDFPTLINLPSLQVAENHVTTTAFRPLRNSHSLGDSCLTGFSVRIGKF